MPTIFSEFFTLDEKTAVDIHKQMWEELKDATTIVDCYCRLYRYIIGGLKWSSRQYRHDEMDKTIDMAGCNVEQMNYSRKYFEDEDSGLGDPLNRMLFEYLDLKEEQDTNKYGQNVFILKVSDDQNIRSEAQKAYRQVTFWSQVEAYNEQYNVEADYHKQHENETLKPPNGKLTFQPFNPDEEEGKQFKLLETFVDALITWVKENYLELKVVLAVKNSDELFKLLFPEDPGKGELSNEERVFILGSMLDKIAALKSPQDKKPYLRKNFGVWVSQELKVEDEKSFWNKPEISSAFARIKGLAKTFEKYVFKPGQRSLIFGAFKTLFTDFLSPDPHLNETEQEAKDRCEEALKRISDIFQKFKPPPNKGELYKKQINLALKNAQARYEKGYTETLLSAKATITDTGYVLPQGLAYALKEKADELLKSLPLLLKENQKSKDKTEARFFTLENFADLAALNLKFKKTNERKTTSVVIFESDPKENGKSKDRPVYRSLMTSEGLGIAFCNLQVLPLGTFYYFPVASAIVEVADRNVENCIRTIDIHNYTITYMDTITKKEKTQPKNKDDHGELYRNGDKTLCFFEDLRANTKWMTISVRRYDPYYSTNPADASKPEPHLKPYMASGKTDRVLPLADKTLCVWIWNDSSRQEYGRLGEVLGLPADREITVANDDGSNQSADGQLCTIGEKQYTLNKYDPQQFRSLGGFYYQFISLKEDGDDKKTGFYVRVNTPTLESPPP